MLFISCDACNVDGREETEKPRRMIFQTKYDLNTCKISRKMHNVLTLAKE